MKTIETVHLESVLREAITKAIKQVGLTAFLATSLFGSNETKDQTSAKKAA